MVLLIVMLNQKMSVFLLDSALCSYSLSEMDSNQKKSISFRGCMVLFYVFYLLQQNIFH